MAASENVIFIPKYLRFVLFNLIFNAKSSHLENSWVAMICSAGGCKHHNFYFASCFNDEYSKRQSNALKNKGILAKTKWKSLWNARFESVDREFLGSGEYTIQVLWNSNFFSIGNHGASSSRAWVRDTPSFLG